MQDDLKFSENEGSLSVMIGRDVDHHTARLMRERIDMAIYERRPKTLYLDFSGVGFMDSSGLGLILGRVDSAGSVGCSVVLVGLSERTMKLIRLAGIERVKNLTVMK